MEASVRIGNSAHYKLETALLLYSDGNDARGTFATRHDVYVDEAGACQLGPAGLLSRDFLRRVVREMEGTVPLEILPENTLARTADSLCWWVPASTQVMYYRETGSPELAALSGGRYPQPALLFYVAGDLLSIRALAENKRPAANTPLYRAPYWNVSDDGTVCLGSTRVPESTSIESMTRWEQAFFESEFTHPNGAQRLTLYPGGFAALWAELKECSAFPSEYLAEAGQTLKEFLRA